MRSLKVEEGSRGEKDLKCQISFRVKTNEVEMPREPIIQNFLKGISG